MFLKDVLLTKTKLDEVLYIHLIFVLFVCLCFMLIFQFLLF